MNNMSRQTLLTIAIAAAVGIGGIAEAYAQSAAGARAERRAAREARPAQAPQQQEARYPEATREEPSERATATFAPQLQRVFTDYEAGETEKAVDAADRIIGNDRANNYEKAMAARVAGVSLINNDDARAIGYLQRALEFNGLNNNEHYEVLYILAHLQSQQEGQLPQALATTDRLLAETRSNRADFHAVRGNILYNMERYAEAVEALKLAVQHAEEPRQDVNQLLMASYAELGQSGEAVKMAEQIAAANPDDVRAQMNLASVYMQAEQSAQAVAVLERLRASGRLTEARQYQNLYAMLLNAENQEAKAIEVINEGLAKGILTDGYEVQNALAQAYYFSGQVDPAIAAWRKAAPLASDGSAYLNLATALFNEGRAAEARTAAQQAIDKGLRNPEPARRIIQNAGR